MWDLRLDGTPYSYVSHFVGVRDGKYKMGWSIRRRIRAGNSIISNFGGNHTSRIQTRRNIQHQGLDQPGPCRVRIKLVISSKDPDTKHHHSVNNHISKCHRGRIIPQWKT
ncbi:hypothetical protein CR513_19907, partial [Mucuna pruriens]